MIVGLGAGGGIGSSAGEGFGGLRRGVRLRLRSMNC